MSVRNRDANGFTLLEVLITLIVLAVGLLGLAHLQTKMQGAQVESYQRAQAVLLLQDMLNRIDANRTGATAGSYVAAEVGTGTNNPAVCAQANIAARDLCEWSNRIKGASEKVDSNGDGVIDEDDTNLGAMIDGRGCVALVQAADFVNCAPAIYRVSVAWQGLNPTISPDLTCAEDDYGADDRLRRVVSAQAVISLPGCQ